MLISRSEWFSGFINGKLPAWMECSRWYCHVCASHWQPLRKLRNSPNKKAAKEAGRIRCVILDSNLTFFFLRKNLLLPQLVLKMPILLSQPPSAGIIGTHPRPSSWSCNCVCNHPHGRAFLPALQCRFISVLWPLWTMKSISGLTSSVERSSG